MKRGQYWRVLDNFKNQFMSPKLNELYFKVHEAECHLLVDENMNRKLGVIRNKGCQFVLRNGKRYYKPKEIREGVKAVHSDKNSHIGKIWEKFELSTHSHAFVGNGNLLHNPHFVAYKNEGTSTNHKQHLFCLITEPYAERQYSCLVVWRNFDISIEDLKFHAHEANNAVIVDYIEKIGEPERGDLKDEILWATYGQRLVKNEKMVHPKELNLEEFYDSRHLILTPYYQEKQDFGIDQLMANPELYKAAVDGEVVKFDTRIMGERINLTELRKALAEKDYIEREPKAGERGSFRFSEDEKTIEMVMHLGVYNHNTIGIRKDQEGNKIVHIVQFPGQSNRSGVTIEDMARYLAEKRKFKDAILLDNGGDVIMYRCQKKAQIDFPGSKGYENTRDSSEKDRKENLRMTSILIFIEKQENAITFSNEVQLP